MFSFTTKPDIKQYDNPKIELKTDYEYNKVMLMNKMKSIMNPKKVNMENMAWEENMSMSMIEDIFKYKDDLPENFVNRKSFLPRQIDALRKNSQNKYNYKNKDNYRSLDKKFRMNG